MGEDIPPDTSSPLRAIGHPWPPRHLDADATAVSRQVQETTSTRRPHLVISRMLEPRSRNMPVYRIQSHTRHKLAQVVAGYVREAYKWTKSGLDGVGF
jgi:hypothetical protein